VSSPEITLRGLTWDHTRGYAPMAVTGQIFADRHPGVRIEWDRRSLWAFGEQALADVVASYDLLVVDHPTIGAGAGAGLLDLDRALGEDFPRIRADAVGACQESYRYGEHYYAVAIDAACQVSAVRDDLLARVGRPRPVRWSEVLELARGVGGVALPMTPLDVYGAFITLCGQLGRPICSEGVFADVEVAERALALLVELAGVCDRWCATADPIQVLERMSTGDDVLCCPLVFGYLNYSRDGYARHPISFHDVPGVVDDTPRGSCLGGAGLAVSGASAHVDLAVEYARWVADPLIQRTEYLRAGGQPAARAAWDDPAADRLTRGFFSGTRASMDSVTVRPRHPGFAAFQSEAARLLHDVVVGGQVAAPAVEQVNDRYARSLDDRWSRVSVTEGMA
jgi:multiple sugar transport system substrate-binding protein